MSAKLTLCTYDQTFKVLKCGTGENWRKSAAQIVSRVKKYYRKSKRKGTSYIHNSNKKKG
jgi:hypothetical protein